MNIQRMRRAELIALVEQLNEARDHTDRVIDGLREELSAAQALADARHAELMRTHDLLVSRPRIHPSDAGRARSAALIHEFDPSVEGSYVQAMKRAREQGGVVRRAQS